MLEEIPILIFKKFTLLKYTDEVACGTAIFY